MVFGVLVALRLIASLAFAMTNSRPGERCLLRATISSSVRCSISKQSDQGEQHFGTLCSDRKKVERLATCIPPISIYFCNGILITDMLCSMVLGGVLGLLMLCVSPSFGELRGKAKLERVGTEKTARRRLCAELHIERAVRVKSACPTLL
jgi:hypothetical protein